MSFRSKKDPQQSFGVRNRLYERVGPSEFSFLRGSFKNAKVDATIRAREPLPEKIDYDAPRVSFARVSASGTSVYRSSKSKNSLPHSGTIAKSPPLL
jgi:hypothetical protein